MIPRLKQRAIDFIQRHAVVAGGPEGNDFTFGTLVSALSINSEENGFAKLSAAEKYLGGEVYTSFASLELKPNLEECLAKDNYPLPLTVDREGYHGERHYDFWLSGLLDYCLIKQRASAHGLELAVGSRIFDFGCATGRVLRHFAAQENGIEVWGSDINGRHVEWVRRYLPGKIRAFQSTSLPHLPLEDNYFDCLYAFSVFSHIDLLEHAWLLELRRILRKGGVAYLTVHTENTWKGMKAGDGIYDALVDGNQYIAEYDVTPSFLASPMPKDRMVFTYKTAKTYNSNVFLSTKYLVDVWGRYFDEIVIYPGGHNYQDVVLLKK